MSFRNLVLALNLLLVSTLAASAEFFGEFSEGPEGEFVDAEPWTEFVLSNEFHFDDPNGLRWYVPASTQVNGASIPPAFWSFIGGPFSGRYLKASVIHDHFVTTHERTAHDTHRNFYYGMRANGVAKWRAKLMYWAVVTFGQDWDLEERVIQNQVCTDVDGDRVCSLTSEVVTAAVERAGVDLEDSAQLYVALAKFSAVARTLNTTDGEFLDVTAFGTISADLDSINTNALEVRRALPTIGEVEMLDLGVGARWDDIGPDTAPTWADEMIPRFNEIDPLAPNQGTAPFRLSPENLPLLKDQFQLPGASIEYSIQ
jgi:hypothetical protein